MRGDPQSKRPTHDIGMQQGRSNCWDRIGRKRGVGVQKQQRFPAGGGASGIHLPPTAGTITNHTSPPTGHARCPIAAPAIHDDDFDLSHVRN